MSIWSKRSTIDWLREMNREIEQETDEVFRRIKEAEALGGCMIPLYDIAETNSETIVTIDIPGVEKEDIDLKLEDRSLALDAHCRNSLPSAKSRLRRYRLMVAFQEIVDGDNATARYRNGLLEVRVPKRSGEGRRITVQ